MGKIKNLHIDMINILQEDAADKYIKTEDGYIYRIGAKARLHLWGWTEFKEKIKGTLLDYKNDGNTIVYQVIKTKEPINIEILEEFGLVLLDWQDQI